MGRFMSSDYTQYGGQAVVEGVMMRSPRYFAVACRKPDQTIVVKTEQVDKTILGKLKWLRWPFLRGTLALIDAMALGTKALTYSAQVQAQSLPGAAPLQEPVPIGEVVPGLPEPLIVEPRGGSRINDIAIGATLVAAVCFGVGVFVALPTLITQLSQRHLGVSGSYALNGVDGLIRIGIFLAYIAAIGRMENIHRVFQYHGAEHKVINNLEAGESLDVENSLRSSRIHPRCGTSFLILVLIASVVVHSIFPRPANYFVRLALHIGLIPVVAGCAYEIIRLAGKFRRYRITQVLLAPGLWTQQLTTREPDASQVEVAIAALRAVLAEEEAHSTTPDKEPEPAAAVA